MRADHNRPDEAGKSKKICKSPKNSDSWLENKFQLDTIDLKSQIGNDPKSGGTGLKRFELRLSAGAGKHKRVAAIRYPETSKQSEVLQSLS